jgi:hypothetical protein
VRVQIQANPFDETHITISQGQSTKTPSVLFDLGVSNTVRLSIPPTHRCELFTLSQNGTGRDNERLNGSRDGATLFITGERGTTVVN